MTFPKDYLLFHSQALLISALIPKPEVQEQKIFVFQAGNQSSLAFWHSPSAESSGGEQFALSVPRCPHSWH